MIQRKDLGWLGLIIEFAALAVLGRIVIELLQKGGYSSKDFQQNTFLLSRVLGELIASTGRAQIVADFPCSMFLSDSNLSWIRGQSFILFFASSVCSFFSTSPVEVGFKYVIIGSSAFPKLCALRSLDKIRYFFTPIGFVLIFLMANNVCWLAVGVIAMIWLEGKEGWQCLYRIPIYAILLQVGVVMTTW